MHAQPTPPHALPDLDSVASAIGWAWYASIIRQEPTVPLVQTRRADLRLREENLHALSLAGFDPSNPDILCIDDVPFTVDFPSSKFALVDHNRLPSKFESQDAKVVAIIDHHPDEGYHTDANPRKIVTPTGSATSLVAEFLQPLGVEQIPPELATLLLCGILIDTNGLKTGGKAEETDYAAAKFLIPISLLSPGDFVASELHPAVAVQEYTKSLTQTLRRKKAEISHLSTRDLFRRDYKEYAMVPVWAPDKSILVGLSSVPIGLKSWISRQPDFWSATEKWMGDCGLSVLGILTSFRDTEDAKERAKGKHRREQLFVVREGAVTELAERVFDGLARSQELDLQEMKFVKDYDVVEGVGFAPAYKTRVWRQGNVEANRKVTAPSVKSIIEGRT